MTDDAVPPSHGPDDVPTDDIRAAQDELRDLAANWADRQEEIDSRFAGDAFDSGSLWADAWRRYRRNVSAMIGSGIFLLMILLSTFAPMVSDANSTTSDLKAQLQGPSAEHWFGTDFQGRDLWKRAWEGGRISLAIAFAVAAVILVIGTIYGAISGYVGGRVDNAMMRLLDALYGLPYLPFAIIFVTVLKEWVDGLPDSVKDRLGEGTIALIYMVPALAITTWFTAARIVRAQVLSLKENEYVESAESQGARWPRIIGRHIIPNAIGIFVIAVFLEVPNAILGEAMLSFLGLGVEIPNSSWGSMAQDGYQFFRTDPHMIIVPGALIAITVLCAVAMADGLRDALDPRQGD